MQFSPHFHRIIYIFIGGQIRGPCALRPTVMLRLESEQKTSKRNISSVYFFAMNIQSPPICVWNVKKLSVPSSCCCSFINAFFFYTRKAPRLDMSSRNIYILDRRRARCSAPLYIHASRSVVAVVALALACDLRRFLCMSWCTLDMLRCRFPGPIVEIWESSCRCSEFLAGMKIFTVYQRSIFLDNTSQIRFNLSPKRPYRLFYRFTLEAFRVLRSKWCSEMW